MTEKQKTITYSEMKKIICDVAEPYTTLFEYDRMSFSELMILENVLLKIDCKLQEKLMEDDKSD